MEDMVTTVRLGSGRGHCFFCDTSIAEGWPCVERRWYHFGGAYRRNNGAATGICPPGVVPEYAHAQCAWRLDASPRGALARCKGAGPGCAGHVGPGERCVNYIATADEGRCSETRPSYWCFACVKAFVKKHRTLLDGHVGAEQAQQGVAWRPPPAFAKPENLQKGCGLPALPVDKKAKKAFLGIWRAATDVAENRAVANHRSLQVAIKLAMKQDKVKQDTEANKSSASGKRKRDV